MASLAGGRAFRKKQRFSSSVMEKRWNRDQKSGFHGVSTLYLQFRGILVADMVSLARPQA